MVYIALRAVDSTFVTVRLLMKLLQVREMLSRPRPGPELTDTNLSTWATHGLRRDRQQPDSTQIYIVLNGLTTAESGTTSSLLPFSSARAQAGDWKPESKLHMQSLGHRAHGCFKGRLLGSVSGVLRTVREHVSERCLDDEDAKHCHLREQLFLHWLN
jgi:hypothetical protein